MIKTSERCEQDGGIRSFENRRGNQDQKDTEKNYSIRSGKTDGSVTNAFEQCRKRQSDAEFKGLTAGEGNLWLYFG